MWARIAANREAAVELTALAIAWLDTVAPVIPSMCHA